MSATEQGLAAGKQRYQYIPRVLVFIFNAQGEVLLLKGAANKKIWANMYNGIGGHIERNEDVRSAAGREIEEETGLSVRDLRLCGVVSIDAGDPALGIGMFVFRAQYQGGDLRPSVEGQLAWVSPQTMADFPLVADLPALIQRTANPTAPFFYGRYWYENDQQHMHFTD